MSEGAEEKRVSGENGRNRTHAELYGNTICVLNSGRSPAVVQDGVPDVESMSNDVDLPITAALLLC